MSPGPTFGDDEIVVDDEPLDVELELDGARSHEGRVEAADGVVTAGGEHRVVRAVRVVVRHFARREGRHQAVEVAGRFCLHVGEHGFEVAAPPRVRLALEPLLDLPPRVVRVDLHGASFRGCRSASAGS
jgi:hypothetical protein